MAFIISLLIVIAKIVCSLLILLYLFFKYTYNHWSRLGLPYVSPKIAFGNFEDSILLKRHVGIIVTDFYNQAKEKGYKYIGVYLFHVPCLIILDPELIKNILLKNFDHFMDRGVYHNEENDPLSAHLAALNGQKWKSVRQKLTPTFTSSKLKKMFGTLLDCTNELVDYLEDTSKKDEPIEAKSMLINYTVDVIGSCAFGLEINSFKNPESDFIKNGTGIFKPKGFDRVKMFMSFLSPSFCNLLKLRVTNKEIDIFFRNLVTQTINYREQNNITRNDFMDLLIQLKNNGKLDEDYEENEDENLISLTLNEVAAQMFVFFIAGFETSSTAMSFTLYELAKNQDLQNELRKEIIQVLKKYNGEISYEAINEMSYLERVVQETLRRHPPSMFLQRVVTKDYQLPDTNTTLKKGTIIFVPVHGLHMDPEYYPDPNKYDPERFNEENKQTRPDLTYIPFGDGPRICIGLRFAMLETKVGLCRILRDFKFTLNPKTPQKLEIDPRNIILDIKGGLWLNVQKVTE